MSAGARPLPRRPGRAEQLAQLRRAVHAARFRTGDASIALEGEDGLFRVVRRASSAVHGEAGPFVALGGWGDIAQTMACLAELREPQRAAESS